MPPLVVVVTGLPCTGKTSLGRRLAQELQLPFLNKDGIKERLFDSLGWSDRAWSRRLSQAAYAVLYYCLEEQVAAGGSLVVESNFSPHLDSPRFQALQTRYGFTVIQVECVTAGEILWQRFVQRAETGERHPGHVDRTTYDEFREMLSKGQSSGLELPGALIRVDTTDFSGVDFSALIAEVRRLRAQHAQAT